MLQESTAYSGDSISRKRGSVVAAAGRAQDRISDRLPVRYNKILS